MADRPNSLRYSGTPPAKPVNPKASVDLAHSGHSISGIVDAILEVGHQRNGLLAQLRAALEAGREKEALTLARRLCGLSYEEKRS